MMPTPDFIICGGVASGTSFLSHTLANHKDIFISKKERPEPNFFHYSWKFEKGLTWYLHEYFVGYAGEPIVGERSSLLFNSALAPTRIKKALGPNTKLIFVLRDPVERSWANYRFTSLEGLEGLDFETALINEQRRIAKQTGKWSEIQPYAYCTRSLYIDAIRRYQKLFRKDNLLFIFSELMAEDPEKTLKVVYDFLNVAPPSANSFPGSYTSPTVLNNEKQVELKTYFGARFSSIIECIRMEVAINDYQMNKTDKIKIGELVANLSKTKKSMPGNAKDFLISKFNDDREQLCELLENDLLHWKW